MKRVSKHGRDTMLLTSHTDDVFIISTFNYNLKTVLAYNANILPNDIRLIRLTKEGCATYSVNKRSIRLSLVKPSE